MKRTITPINEQVCEYVWGVLKETANVGFSQSSLGNLSDDVMLSENKTGQAIILRYDEWSEIYEPVLTSLSLEGDGDYWRGRNSQDALSVIQAHLSARYEAFISAKRFNG